MVEPASADAKKAENATTLSPPGNKDQLVEKEDCASETRALSETTSADDAVRRGEKAAVGAEVEESADQDAVDDREEGGNHITGVPLILLAFGLCVTTFLIGLDQMIIATAIPKITSDFESLNDVGWYGSAYLLTTTSLQPSFGKIYSFFNVKFTFIIALAVFEVGSIVCAVAKDSLTLIVGRAVAGTGAAGLFSGGMTIIGYAVPLRRRALYIACLSSMFGISSIVGPILGGVFTDRLSWRWCFWINLPFGGVAIATVFFFFKNPTRDFTNKSLKEKINDLDLLGAAFLISGVVCLLLALQWGGVQYKWSDSRVFGCFIGFGLIITVFIVIQLRKGEKGTIPPRILKQRTVMATAFTLAFMSMGIFAHIYFLPFYFQAVKGASAEQSGIRVIPYLISNTVFALFTGILVTIFGYYTPFIYFGTALFTVGSGLIHTFTPNTPKATWIGYQILAGGGSGCAIQLPFIAVQTVLPAKEMPTGNAIAIFFNSLGGAIAISIAQNIFSNTLVKELPKHVPGVDPQAIVMAGATNIGKVVPSNLLSGVLEAYNTALVTAFVLPVAVGGLSFLSSLLFEWKSVKGKNLMHAAPGA